LFDNIGADGENLTIAVLSMNRSSLTIKLMNSVAEYIPNFKGIFLIGDNGSEQSEKDILYTEMSKMPFRCKMVEFDQNYGVAGGRNRLFEKVETEWILSLDNDIYFINNPIKKIKDDIALLGCHFLCMPLINKEDNNVQLFGGHLYVENVDAGVSIGGGSAYIDHSISANESYEPFLCTFLPGGTCILRKDTFFACGGYDEGMFVGFEDAEFSMRLFQYGYKIGSCGVATLIHDHPKPANNADSNYEKQRFSNVRLYESAKYFENKHGIQVWNPMVEDWVNQRLRELLDDDDSTVVKNITETSSREKVLLVVDKPGWALDNIATQIKKHCSDVFEFKTLYLSDIDNVWATFLYADDCKIVHFLWRSWLADVNSDYAKSYAVKLGMSPDIFYEKYISNKIITTSVYDHLFLDDDFNYTETMFSCDTSPIKAYTVSSKILDSIYSTNSKILKKPSHVITDGVDLNKFQPSNLERFRTLSGRNLIVGWAGNSMWAAEKEDFKGLHTILKPAIEALQEQGYPIELRICDSNVKYIPHDEMPSYYEQIDLYVCPSKIEGTPNPILECMACGVPFISTNVGIVSEVSGEMQSKYILSERTKNALQDKLIEILENPDILVRLSKENLCSIQNWDWKIKARQFIDFWNEAKI